MKTFEDFCTKVSWYQFYRTSHRRSIIVPRRHSPLPHYTLLDSFGREWNGTRKDLTYFIKSGFIK